MTAHSPVKVILWSAPRCTSTLFEHSIGQLPEVKTFHEVFTNAAYFGEERTYNRYLDHPPDPDLKFSDVREMLETKCAEGQAIFCKEMAYSVTGRYDALPRGYQHSFLIRHPRKAITSLYRIAVSGEVCEWNDFDPREAGFHDMWCLYEHLCGSTATPPVVIDSDELLSRPRNAMHAYCDHLGLDFQETMLQWDNAESGERLQRWGPVWYRTLLNSTGFATSPQTGASNHPPLPAPIEAVIEAAQPYYEKLFARRLLF